MPVKISLTILALLVAGIVDGAPAHAPWPGGIGVIRLEADTRPVVTLGDKRVLVFDSNGVWKAVVGIPLDQDASVPLELEVTVAGEAPKRLSIDLRDADYRVQRLNVDRKYVDPGEEALERIFAEREIIDAALTNWRPEDRPELGLGTPVPGARSSSFGSRRIFNDQPRSPHKGMDIAAMSGTPILAPGAAVVAATGDYYFNGNTVILDHGQGFISLYCHLSEIAVEEGQAVVAGNSWEKSAQPEG
jgi:murein DD-endopeptidase MepM/ murein hydrolase activator NlpD